jgi:hypothetical protein
MDIETQLQDYFRDESVVLDFLSRVDDDSTADIAGFLALHLQEEEEHIVGEAFEILQRLIVISLHPLGKKGWRLFTYLDQEIGFIGNLDTVIDVIGQPNPAKYLRTKMVRPEHIENGTWNWDARASFWEDDASKEFWFLQQEAACALFD